MVIITITNSKLLNAGPKAKLDVAHILKETYKKEIEEKTLDFKVDYQENGNIIKKIHRNVMKTYSVFKTNFYSGIKIFQYPLCSILNEMKVMPRKHVILFIHDLLETRKDENSKKAKKEIEFLKTFNYLIVHNEKMKRYLVERGIREKNVFVLELFDYLCKNDMIERKNELDKMVKVIYAGNLDKTKSPFLYQINQEKINFKINLYGKGIEKDISDKITYQGAFLPDELPNKIEGNLGLVWDGKFDETDENQNVKNYTKYNNPHKLSCYIAAGIPVIVWRKSAIADFVDKYNIGYKISNIYDINHLDFSDYNQKLKNVKEISEKVRSGYFTKKVMSEILNDLKI